MSAPRGSEQVQLNVVAWMQQKDVFGFAGVVRIDRLTIGDGHAQDDSGFLSNFRRFDFFFGRDWPVRCVAIKRFELQFLANSVEKFLALGLLVQVRYGLGDGRNFGPSAVFGEFADCELLATGGFRSR